MQGEGEVDHQEKPSPLTDKERVMIHDSWTKVYQNCDDVGVAILVRYFFPCSFFSLSCFTFELFFKCKSRAEFVKYLEDDMIPAGK